MTRSDITPGLTIPGVFEHLELPLSKVPIIDRSDYLGLVLLLSIMLTQCAAPWRPSVTMSPLRITAVLYLGQSSQHLHQLSVIRGDQNFDDALLQLRQCYANSYF